MDFMYSTQGTCAKKIRVKLDGNTISEVEFLEGGCPGNLKAIPKLVKGMTVEQIETTLSGNTCGNKPTSCADQLAKAVRAAYEDSTRKAYYGR